MQGSLIWSTIPGKSHLPATRHKYWAHALGPQPPATEAVPRACAPHGKPLDEKPEQHKEGSFRSAQLETACAQQQRPTTAKTQNEHVFKTQIVKKRGVREITYENLRKIN